MLRVKAALHQHVGTRFQAEPSQPLFDGCDRLVEAVGNFLHPVGPASFVIVLLKAIEDFLFLWCLCLHVIYDLGRWVDLPVLTSAGAF